MKKFRIYAKDLLARAALTMLVALVSVAARPDSARHHVFHLDSLHDPLSVVSVVQERDGGMLEVLLTDPNGKKAGCEFNYKRSQDHGPQSAFGRLYVDEWLAPLGSPEQERIAGAVRRYVAGTGKQTTLANRLLSAVNYLEQLSKSASIKPSQSL